MHINADILSVICKFLTPLELCHLRKLNRYFHKCVNAILLQQFSTVCLQDRSCPMCGDWISSQDLKSYDEFFSIHPSQSSTLISWIQDTVFGHRTIQRCALLCESCEYDEKELDENSSQMFHKMLPFAGTRQYHLFVCQSFAIIYRLSSLNDDILWNELRGMIDPTIYS